MNNPGLLAALSLDSPATWALIWLVITAMFAFGEMAAPGSFFLAPFGIGGLAAAIASVFGTPILLSFLLFLAISFGAFLFLRPLATRLDATVPLKDGVGAHRLIGAVATVVEAIPVHAGSTGMVKTGGETWRADGNGKTAFGEREQVRIVEVVGTKVVVEPIM